MWKSFKKLFSHTAGVFPQAHAGERILTLEELAQQPVNQHKPIIVINTSPGFVFSNHRVHSPIHFRWQLLLHSGRGRCRLSWQQYHSFLGREPAQPHVARGSPWVSFISIHNVLFVGPLCFGCCSRAYSPLFPPILSLSLSHRSSPSPSVCPTSVASQDERSITKRGLV